MLRVSVIVSVLLFSSAFALAETIDVPAEDGALAAALENAAPGDMLRLAPGTHAGSQRVPDGVEIRGSETGASVIVGDDFSVLNIVGNEVVVRDVEIRGGEAVQRGINAMSSIRVQGCTFTSIPEAVALMGTPLTDVLDCTFSDCRIGVRAIGWACPTVRGCTFRGGGMGVFAMDSAPRVRDCTFIENDTGLLAAGEFRRLVIRNCVFVAPKKGAIETNGGDIMGISAIANCVFLDCPVVLKGAASHVERVRNGVLIGCGEEPFQSRGGEAIESTETSLVTMKSEYTLRDDGTVAITDAAPMEGLGETFATDAPDAVAGVGRVTFDADDLPVRFREKPFVVNETREQYAYMRLHRLQMTMQSVGEEDGRRYDYMKVVDGGEEREIKFDINRYWGMF